MASEEVLKKLENVKSDINEIFKFILDDEDEEFSRTFEEYIRIAGKNIIKAIKEIK